MNPTEEAAESRELILTRLIDAPPEKVYSAWTEPALLKQWFCPKPWSVASAELDVRPGGVSAIVMRSPEGQEFPSTGVYLEVVENQRLVFTDAYTCAWEPSAKPFMTGIITFENEGGQTRYTARVLHWSAADRKTHEERGFHEGWGKATDQLAALLAEL
ncbi:SRPBCC family protein [Methylomonas montana]|uniref:SRPBCC family protein n=1 Tax=Methylomonas montana TaxID=3058963 RepID=UPI00265A8DFE|nr:SRPBCC family protein [Methylomonas montana]WKJ90602.1 SRPBCC family protein [Methylomonas montana]